MNIDKQFKCIKNSSLFRRKFNLIIDEQQNTEEEKWNGSFYCGKFIYIFPFLSCFSFHSIQSFRFSSFKLASEKYISGKSTFLYIFFTAIKFYWSEKRNKKICFVITCFNEQSCTLEKLQWRKIDWKSDDFLICSFFVLLYFLLVWIGIDLFFGGFFEFVWNKKFGNLFSYIFRKMLSIEIEKNFVYWRELDKPCTFLISLRVQTSI